MTHKSGSQKTVNWVPGLRLAVGLLASALLVSACGGGGGGDVGAASGGESTIGGTPGVNACVTGNIVDMQCYMVPGVTGDKPVVKETAYQWSSTKNKFVSKGERTRSFDIQANRADIVSSGALSVGSFSYEWDGTTFTVNNPDGSTAEFSQTFALGTERSFIETSGTGTVIAHQMVFAPKSRTITLPGTNDKVTVNNAILRVVMEPTLPMAHVAILVPGKGAVAAIDYLGCVAADDGTFKFLDDVSYYETNCGHGNFMKADEASLRLSIGAAGGTTPGGSGGASCSAYPGTLTTGQPQVLQSACGTHTISLRNLASPGTSIAGTLTVSSTTSGWSIAVTAPSINVSLNSATATGSITTSPATLMLMDASTNETITISNVTSPLSGSISTVSSDMYTFDE